MSARFLWISNSEKNNVERRDNDLQDKERETASL